MPSEVFWLVFILLNGPVHSLIVCRSESLIKSVFVHMHICGVLDLPPECRVLMISGTPALTYARSNIKG